MLPLPFLLLLSSLFHLTVMVVNINAEPFLSNTVPQRLKSSVPMPVPHIVYPRKFVDGDVYNVRTHQNVLQPASGGIKKQHVDGIRTTTTTRRPVVSGCFYRGKYKNVSGIEALRECYPKILQHGLATADDAHRWMVISSLRNASHFAQKRSNSETTVSINKKSLPENQEDRGRSTVDSRTSNDELTIELGLFIDDALWLHFKKQYGTEADSELQTYAFAIVNNINALFRHNSLKPPIQLVVNYYEVMKIPPVEMSRNLHGSGDAIRLLDLFCDYQAKISGNSTYSKRWDHALLFTGYDLYRGKVRTVAGYAPVKGMCSETRSCTISEGLDFGAVFVVAHEMGHSLGMSHDGDNSCDASCCIMSTSVGTGRTLWSPCSVRELNNFIAQLDENGSSKNCLRISAATGTDNDNDGDKWKSNSNNNNDNIRAGQMYTLDEQCMSFHGECWRHELKHGQHINDVCQMIWCGNGEGIIRSAHPALEYTYCGYQMWCKEGHCARAAPGEMIVRHGGWSEWDDNGRGSCASECSPCQIEGQIRLRRSIRLCNNPFPQNGGSYCYGDDARGIRCQEEKCNGISIEQFATESCTKLRDSDDPSTKTLTGKGLQYDGDLCKIWCVLPREQIRTTSNFPDGTPCGTNRYCVKGRCRNLDCNGRAVVESRQHCPPQYLLTLDDGIHTRKRIPTAILDSTSSLAGEPRPHPYNDFWSTWSEWSNCTASTCRQQGFRIRRRTCAAVGSVACKGFQRQRKICYGECADKQWSAWSQCSASCGFGVERRVSTGYCPTCTPNDRFTDTRACFLKECEPLRAGWSSWGPWEPCNCSTRYRIRRRKCLHMRCKGTKVELTKCKETECTATSSKFPATPTWMEWSEWSACSKSCDQGISKRRRKCSLPNGCIGPLSVHRICNGFPCK